MMFQISPAFATSLPEGARVSLRTHSLTVGIIIELNEFRTPPNEHGMLGVQRVPVVRRLCGQVSGAPTGVASES